QSRTGGHPMYTTVRENDPILGIVIFTLVDRVVDCLSNPIAIVRMNPRNKMFERDFSGSRPSPKSPSRVRDPGLIFAQLPFPNPQMNRACRQSHALFPYPLPLGFTI